MAGSYVIKSNVGDGAGTATHDARYAKVLAAKVVIMENFILRWF